MRITFVYPSSHQRAGGVTMLYEFANALGRRGDDVHFVHGPKRHARDNRVTDIEQIPFQFDAAVTHHIVDTIDDPSVPDGDVVFGPNCPARLGQPAAIVQGFRLIGPIWDAAAFRAPMPKICVASWLVDVGRSYGVPDEQLVHIPMGMDHELFSARNGPHDRPIDVAVLFHPNREKGWDVARLVLEELSRRRPDFRAVVFSLAGPPRQPMPPGVDIVLDLDQCQLADDVYNSTKVLLQASRHEGFGLTAIEAMGCGAALVTTDCGGSRDYAFHGTNAIVVPAEDVGGLTDSVEMLLNNDERRIALAAEGEHSVRTFDWERSADLLVAFLEHYLTDPARFQVPPGDDRSKEYTL